MAAIKLISLSLVLGLAVYASLAAAPIAATAQNTGTQAAASAKSKVKAVGTMKSIAGNTIALTTDAGDEVTITLQDSTRLVRTLPGQTDLKTATPVAVQDLQPGDRLLIGGTSSDDGKSIAATTVIVMKKSDIADKQERERADWNQRGVGGIVKKVDSAAGAIIISSGPLGKDTVTVQVSKNTVIRRYAPDSVKFDDAKPGTLDQIQSGDQLRARGDKSGDGKQLAAEEVVSGSFRNVVGMLNSVDAANNTITLTDLVTKRPVTIKVGADSRLHKLPPMAAQRIAMILKGGAAAAPGGGANGNAGAGSGGSPGGARPQGEGQRAGGPPDFQRMLSRMPTVTAAELQKGEALMLVATEGSASSPSTVIVLLSGVEPILTAAPNQASTILSPWNLSGGAAAAAAGGDNP
jgi:hypothetical protein